jgi:hypothetical protein
MWTVYTAQKQNFFIASFPQTSETLAQVSLAFFPNFTQNLMSIRCSKHRSLIFATRRVEKNTSYQRHNFHTAGVNVFKS